MQINILIEVEENLKNGRKRHGKKRVREERKTRRYGHMPKEFGPRILKCRMEKKKKKLLSLSQTINKSGGTEKKMFNCEPANSQREKGMFQNTCTLCMVNIHRMRDNHIL